MEDLSKHFHLYSPHNLKVLKQFWKKDSITYFDSYQSVIFLIKSKLTFDSVRSLSCNKIQIHHLHSNAWKSIDLILKQVQYQIWNTHFSTPTVFPTWYNFSKDKAKFIPVTKLQFSTKSANFSNTANKYLQKLRTLNWHVKYKNTQCCCVEFIFSLKSSRAEVAWFPGTLRCTHRRWNHLV